MDSVPVEYLYIDHRRLDAYVAQIQGGLTAYDKIPSYSIELSISGLKVQVGQSGQPRDRTAPEKLRTLREHLRKVDPDFGAFEERQLWATKIILPRSIFQYPPELPEAVFWVSFGDETRPTVYLIEGYAGADGSPTRCSGYSGLVYLLSNVYIPTDFDETSASRKEAQESPQDEGMRISDDDQDCEPPTVAFLKALGAVVSEKRTIRSLYRIRVRGMGDYVVGYPVYVADDR